MLIVAYFPSLATEEKQPQITNTKKRSIDDVYDKYLFARTYQWASSCEAPAAAIAVAAAAAIAAAVAAADYNEWNKSMQ